VKLNSPKRKVTRTFDVTVLVFTLVLLCALSSVLMNVYLMKEMKYMSSNIRYGHDLVRTLGLEIKLLHRENVCDNHQSKSL